MTTINWQRLWPSLTLAIAALGIGLLLGGQPAKARADTTAPAASGTYTNPVVTGTNNIASSNLDAWEVGTLRQAADDFAVPSGSGVVGWIVTKLYVPGTYQCFDSSNPATSVLVEFYRDTSGLPQANPLYSRSIPGAQVVGLASGSFTITLSLPAFLPVGQTYWISIQAIMPTTGRCNWLWASGGPQIGAQAAYYDTLAEGCGTSSPRVWARRAADCSVVPTEPEQRFAFDYTEFIPTEFIYTPIIRR